MAGICFVNYKPDSINNLCDYSNLDEAKDDKLIIPIRFFQNELYALD